MLVGNQEAIAGRLHTSEGAEGMSTIEVEAQQFASKEKQSLLARALRIEWLGQTVASLCWIVSVFTYGISSAGDWLQLAAATAWLIANIAALLASADA